MILILVILKQIEGDKNNNNTSNASQQAFIAIGKIIQNNHDLRNIVQRIILDLLLNEPQQAEIVVNALDSGYKYLAAELEKDNSVLTLQKQLQGEVSTELFLTKIGDKQLEYMRNHLVDINQYGNYFAKGLENRLKIAVTTNQSVSGL